MKKTIILSVLAAMAMAARAQDAQDAQDLTGAVPAAQTLVDRMKGMAADALNKQQLPPAGAAVLYDFDPVTKVDVGSGKTIKLTSFVSNCPGVTIPFAVDARAMTAGRATPGGKPLVVAGVLMAWSKGPGACGGIAMPMDFEVANPVPNSLPMVEVAGTPHSNYKLAEAKGAQLSGSQIELTVYVRADEKLAGAFAVDATAKNGGKPAVIVGAVVFQESPAPNTAVPAHVQAVRVMVANPIAAPNPQLQVAGR